MSTDSDKLGGIKMESITMEDTIIVTEGIDDLIPELVKFSAKHRSPKTGL